MLTVCSNEEGHSLIISIMRLRPLCVVVIANQSEIRKAYLVSTM